jgi:sulfoxide reductase heme-binding subunit YedZ
MSSLWWYVARSSGIVAWALGIASVLWGTALATKVFGRRPRPAWLLDLHRFLGATTVVFVALHVLALMADSYVHFDVVDVLVPFASSWKPLAVAVGVLAFWLLALVEATSLVRSQLPKRVWHGIHLTSYAVAVLSSLHLLLAGTDAGNPVLRVATFGWIPLVLGMLLYRRLAPPPAPRIAAAAMARVPVAATAASPRPF